MVGELASTNADAELQTLMPDQACNGYWHTRPGLEWVPEPA
jgi:hypothetical protein